MVELECFLNWYLFLSRRGILLTMLLYSFFWCSLVWVYEFLVGMEWQTHRKYACSILQDNKKISKMFVEVYFSSVVVFSWLLFFSQIYGLFLFYAMYICVFWATLLLDFLLADLHDFFIQSSYKSFINKIYQ